MSLRERMIDLAHQAKAASRELARLSSAERNECLLGMAKALEAGQGALLDANQLDLQAGQVAGLSSALLDRLRLDERRIQGMVQGLRQVAALPDPVGRIIEERTRPNGLRLQKIAVPIGVIVIIYESRPNVTADAAGLCFKTGNATILRGGKEARHSNQAIADTLARAVEQCRPQLGAPAIQLVPTTDREAIPELLSLTDCVDLCIPRGGEQLIRAVTECSKVPVIKHYKGVCHVYVDGDADPAMAEAIVLNAKLQRPGVCNAMETLLVDHHIAPTFLPAVARKLASRQVELRGDPETLALLQNQIDGLKPATPEDWSTEYLDRILSIRVVNGVSEGIDHINRYGSSHSDSIVTQNQAAARRFLQEVDSAAVYWNASTRFTDGAEFGMGAEIGISTDKIGARGPMGLEELTTYKWLGYGTGQIRE